MQGRPRATTPGASPPDRHPGVERGGKRHDSPEEAFAGIDVAIARGKRLPVCVCVRRGDTLQPLPLKSLRALPPHGIGNPGALVLEERIRFADDACAYLHRVEDECGVRIRRIAIDAPSAPTRPGLARRRAEVALDQLGIRCFSTPSVGDFERIADRGQAHLDRGGAAARLPHANQLWMLVGFALFDRLGTDFECMEVYPQAAAWVLRAAGTHKRHEAGFRAQLTALAARTAWPEYPERSALTGIGFGARDDRLDAYLSAWIASLPEEEREPLGAPPEDVIWVPAFR